MPKRSEAQSTTIPPPVSGLNSKDPISSMDPLYAVDAENFISNSGAVNLRNGSRYHAKNIGSGIVSTVAEYVTPAGTYKLIGIDTSGFIYDATAAGAATDITLSAFDPVRRWQVPIQFRGKLFICGNNNTSKTFVWNGTGAVTNGGFTGLGINNFLVTIYKGRIYWGAIMDSGFGPTPLSIYYAERPLNITGNTVEFDLSSLFTKGGGLVFIGPTSRDGAESDANFVAISNRGEILVYAGEYPGSATWELIGQYFVPAPVGLRPTFYWGGDLCIITTQGVVSLAALRQGGPSLSFITDKVNAIFRALLVNTSNTANYCCGCWSSENNLLVINIPTTDSATPTTVQLVMDTETGSWWKWTGLAAYHWTTWNGFLVFGSSNGRIFKANVGNYDEDPANEGAVLTRNIKLRPAFNYFDNPTLYKQFTMARPIIYQSEGLALTMDCDVDYNDTVATSTVTDATDTAYKLYRPPMGLKGIGKAASIRIDGTVTTKRISLQAIEVIWNEGDIV